MTNLRILIPIDRYVGTFFLLLEVLKILIVIEKFLLISEHLIRNIERYIGILFSSTRNWSRTSQLLLNEYRNERFSINAYNFIIVAG